jgi:2-amino-4-hydroxy-6-hydroxymethyldihydropteridine diphosphokinase
VEVIAPICDGHVIIGLGGNLEPRLDRIVEASTRIAELPRTKWLRGSPVYESAPLGPPQPRYLNAAVRIHTALSLTHLMQRLLAIECDLGRDRGRQTVRWGPRAIDLDILWAPAPVCTADLVVPHPELTKRAFALRPLLDVAPELRSHYEHALRTLDLEEPLTLVAPHLQTDS